MKRLLARGGTPHSAQGRRLVGAPIRSAGVILLPVVVLGGLWAGRQDPARPSWVFPTQMGASPASRSHAANPVLARLMGPQAPVAGTLARGARNFHYEASDAERQRAGKELRNPLRPTPAMLAEGRRLYDTSCRVCHGAKGAGDGPVIPKFPNPPSFRSKRVMALSDGELFHTITLGRKKMAGFADQLSWDDRWKVVFYLRTLQEGKR